MLFRHSISALFAVLAVTALAPAWPAAGETAALTGKVSSAEEGQMEGVVVSAKKVSSPSAW